MRAFVAFTLAIAVTLTVLVHHAVAAPYLPPAGQLFHGVAGSTTVDRFAAQTGKAPAVFQLFVAWGDAGWAFTRAGAQDGRLMLHVSTYNGPGTQERISRRRSPAARATRSSRTSTRGSSSAASRCTSA